MLQTTKFDTVLFGAVGDLIAKKVRASHAPSVQARGFAEHVHAYQLVELLLPVVREHGFELSLDLNLDDDDGDDIILIDSPEAIIKEMNQCDEEWLLVHKPGEPSENVFHVFMVYGNNADDPESGRGEMMADWGGLEAWYRVFDPVVDDFINDAYINKA
jgi:hypothetical protein